MARIEDTASRLADKCLDTSRLLGGRERLAWAEVLWRFPRWCGGWSYSGELATGYEDGQAGRVSAIDCAARAAWRTGTLRSTFRSIVDEVAVSTESYRRIAYRVERRVVRLRFGLAHGSRAGNVGGMPDPSRVDPWGVDVVGLPGLSRVLVVCPGCGGRTTVACALCRGGGRVSCHGCGGGGRVQGKRGLKNCPGCRGSGMRACGPCRAGQVTCPGCEGVGRAFAWLEVERSESTQVRVAPATGLAQLHRGAYEVADFDAAASGRAVPLADDSGWIPPVACALGGELAPQLTASTDRVVAQRIQKFESPVYGVGYRTRWGRGTVRVSGRPGMVVPDSDWSALRWRALGGAAAGVGVFGLGMLAVGRYVAQHAWFELQGNAWWMRLLALCSGFFAAVLTGRLLAVSRCCCVTSWNRTQPRAALDLRRVGSSLHAVKTASLVFLRAAHWTRGRRLPTVNCGRVQGVGPDAGRNRGVRFSSGSGPIRASGSVAGTLGAGSFRHVEEAHTNRSAPWAEWMRASLDHLRRGP